VASILFVDGRLGMDSQVRRSLMRIGHQVAIASNVNQARSWLAKNANPPDLIIVDVGIKDFKGLEFIQALKASKAWGAIPILVQTMSQNCDFFEMCDGSLLKPYSKNDLIQQINLILKSA
jgi:DNA-binding response OmpR family regulator